ncbi:TonB-dependent receptor plug domain-containing protein [Flavobacterium sp.]|uniref:TonB-dependent receptor plug domain-containing protein n=1 Tax=Flavobacterium sp. TaxID=239 RepID=UPI003D0C01E7
MKKNLHYLNLMFFLAFTTLVLAQKNVKITGVIKNSSTLENIYAAKVAIVPADGDNEIYSTYTDFTGAFTLKGLVSQNRLKVSFFNFKTTYIVINEMASTESGLIDLKTITLTPDIQKQIENASSIVDVVQNRKTPIASSTVFQSDLQLNATNNDFIELANDMSGAYVSRMGGGFGDSQLRLRGFDQNNITPMTEGISLYDLENGNVDWTGMVGLTDALSSVQLQKGLGASKLVNSSVAGSINFLFKDAFAARGGEIFTSTGINGFRKFGASYGTGKLKNGFGFNIMLNNMSGDGYIQKTDFNATSYFLALGYENRKHNFQFKLMGTPQWHNQRNTMTTIGNYFDLNGENFDRTYNIDWGLYQGNTFNAQSNNSHKPMAILQWDYKFNSNDQLSVKAYSSIGKSSNVRLIGHDVFASFDNVPTPYLTDHPDFQNNHTQIDFDYVNGFNTGKYSFLRYTNFNLPKFPINTININSILPSFIFYNLPDGTPTYAIGDISGVSQSADNKETRTYGAIANIDKSLTKILKINAGVDLRKTSYNNYRTIENLFGADAFAVSSDFTALTNDLSIYNNIITEKDLHNTRNNILNSFKSVNQSSKVNYDFTSNINYAGGYAQIEANFEKINLLAQGGYNRQFLSRNTYNLITKEGHNSELVTIDGYNAKIGANFNITNNHNAWLNGGIVSRAPIYTNVFSSFSETPNTNYKNEDFYSAEAGYGLTLNNLLFKVNGYWALHKDSTIPYADAASGFFGATTGINRENYGVEADLSFYPFKQMNIFSNFSYGVWKYKTNADFTYYNSGAVNTLYVKNNFIGGIPQTMANLGFKVFVAKGLQLGMKGRYYDRFYTNSPIERFDPVFYNTNYFDNSLQLPSYAVIDCLADYTIELNNQHKLKLTLNMDNMFDAEYIMESNSSFGKDQNIPNTQTTYGTVFGDYNGIAKNNSAFFGFGRTWNFSARYSF